MNRFSALYDELQSTRSTRQKVDSMVGYFSKAPPDDIAVAVFLLSGRRIKRLIPMARVRELLEVRTGLPLWLLEACHSHVGDFAETAQLLNQPKQVVAPQSLAQTYRELLRWRDISESERLAELETWLNGYNGLPLMLILKMLTGALRVGVSEGLVVQALSQWSGQSIEAISQQMLGQWEPDAQFFDRLKRAESLSTGLAPRTFCLASPLEEDVHSLGPHEDYLIEWKWDGIRAQIIHSPGATFIWSRGQEYVTHQFPEIVQACQRLNQSCILDGEILAWKDGEPAPFAILQTRLGRKLPTLEVMRQAPVVLFAFDLLLLDDADTRTMPLSARRDELSSLIDGAASPILQMSKTLPCRDWNEVEYLHGQAEEHRAEGLMLKRLDSLYSGGRKRGYWWKWKIQPKTVDVVMTAAEFGHGKRANLYTDYTLSVWQDSELVPVAKAYSGLTDSEIAEVDRWIRENITGRFGPIRSVKPQLVFELAFEGIATSTRHRSGVALRFPRIARWRHDKKPADADTLDSLKRMIPELKAASGPVSSQQLELDLK